MSTFEYPTVAQATHVLTLLNQANLSKRQMGQLQDGYLSALAIAAREDRLPLLIDFRDSLRPRGEFPTWKTLSIQHTQMKALWRDVERTSRNSVFCPSFLEMLGYYSDTALHLPTEIDLVRVTPADLRIDPWLLQELGPEGALAYLCRRAREHGLETPSFAVALELYLLLEPRNDMHVLLVSSLADGSTLNYRYVIEVERYSSERRRISFRNKILDMRTAYTFARPRKK